MSRRDQIAEALSRTVWCLDALDQSHGKCSCLNSRRIKADRLMPLIDRLCAEAAAEELTGMADAVRTTEVLFQRDDGSGVKFGDLLRERASTLRTEVQP